MGEKTVEDDLFDVIAVHIETGAERFIERRKTKRNAEAIINLAIMRRGLEEEFYDTKPHPHVLRARSHGGGSE